MSGNKAPFSILGFSGSWRTLVSSGSASLTSASEGIAPSAVTFSLAALVGIDGSDCVFKDGCAFIDGGAGGTEMYICSSFTPTYSSSLSKMSRSSLATPWVL
jgi:hypothetical protein